MPKTDLPENLLTYLRAWLNEGGWFTEAQANEIIRRYEAEPRLREALEEIRDHDTHNLHGNKGNAHHMAVIAKQALEEKGQENER